MPNCWYIALVCNRINLYFVCVVLIGDANDSVNTELATAGNGEVVGNMCNRSRYVLRCFSSANFRGLDLACQHPGSANVSNFLFICKIPLMRRHYGSGCFF